jgi:muramoyltetrapeptide carboxypeptidase
MIIPPSLSPGDNIGIVATGRKVKPDQLEAAVKIFSSWQLNVRLAPHLFSDDHTYLAGTDEQRLADLQSMINDPSIKAIICARGGYGTTRILDSLNFQPLRQNPKWIAGFSDITALHLKLFHLGYQSIHGTMPIIFSKTDAPASIESLRKTLFGEPQLIEAGENKNNKPGKAQGQMIGGNLSLILDAMGTANEPDTTGKILVIEEIDEYLYRIDRMLMQLKRTGKFDHLAGLVVGHITDIKDAENFGQTPEEIIRYHTKDYDFPIGFGFPIGHENPNRSWKHGAPMQLTTSPEKSTIHPI